MIFNKVYVRAIIMTVKICSIMIIILNKQRVFDKTTTLGNPKYIKLGRNLENYKTDILYTIDEPFMLTINWEGGIYSIKFVMSIRTINHCE